MTDELYDQKALDNFFEIENEIKEKINNLKEEIYEQYGFCLKYDDIYLPNPYERTIYIT